MNLNLLLLTIIAVIYIISIIPALILMKYSVWHWHCTSFMEAVRLVQNYTSVLYF